MPEAAILAMRGASGSERAVLEALYLHADADGRCYPGYETIAEVVGCNHSTVARAIRGIERRGVLWREERPRGSRAPNVYHLLVSRCEIEPTDTGVGAKRDHRVGAKSHRKQLRPSEQLASEQPEHIREAARALTRWWGREITPEAVRKVTGDAMPSEIRRAVANVTSRKTSAVQSPSAILALCIRDEVTSRVPV